MRLTGTCVLVLSVFVFAVPAYAGNGNGNGNGNSGTSDAAPGNSASAPGQMKKEEAAAPAQTTTTATTTVAAPSAAPTEGVKPSNSTAHETHAQAESDDTRLYGNGQTAGGIAIDHGAPGNTVLHGPGNSQPHKAAPCAGGHERDVHALQGRHSARCGSNPPGPTPNPTPDPTRDPKPDHTPDPTPNPPNGPKNDKQPTPDPAPTPAQPSAGGDAPAAVASSAGRGDTQGVLSLAGRAASLPFTGRELWLVVVAGIMLIATGLGLRQIQTVEASVESGHDHTNRARRSAGSSRPPVGGRSGR